MEQIIFNINDLNEETYNKWYNLLHPLKKERIDRFRFFDDKKRSVAGDMIVKTALAEFCGVSAENIVIETDENGKPYPVNINLHFNISHAEDYVVCVVSDNKIGVDIEKIKPVNLNIAKRFFNEEEQIYIFGHKPHKENFEQEPTKDLLKRFFEVWTAKEAFLKYLGVGLTENLQEIKVNQNNLHHEYFDDYIISIYE